MALRPRIPRPPIPRMGSKREDDRKHLDIIKTLCCAVYGTPGPNDPHHLQRGVDHMPAGMGRTSEDRYAIPLSRKAHDFLHTNKYAVSIGEESWLMEMGVDGRALAKALWGCRDQGRDAYERIIMRHLQKNGIYP